MNQTNKMWMNKCYSNIHMNTEINKILGNEMKFHQSKIKQIEMDQKKNNDIFQKLNDNILETSNCLKQIKTLQEQFDERITETEKESNKKFNKLNLNILTMNKQFTEYQESNKVQNGFIISNTNKINQLSSNIKYIETNIAKTCKKVDNFIKTQV